MKSLNLTLTGFCTLVLIAASGCNTENKDPDENMGLNEVQTVQYSTQSVLNALKGFSGEDHLFWLGCSSTMCGRHPFHYL